MFEGPVCVWSWGEVVCWGVGIHGMVIMPVGPLT